MSKSIPVRLPEGIYEAVTEIAQAIGLDKSNTAALLVMVGLDDVSPDFWSARVKALIQADGMESRASFLRTWAKLPSKNREELEEALGTFMSKLLVFRLVREAIADQGDRE